jgi:hypothetical protein
MSPRIEFAASIDNVVEAICQVQNLSFPKGQGKTCL